MRSRLGQRSQKRIWEYTGENDGWLDRVCNVRPKDTAGKVYRIED